MNVEIVGEELVIRLPIERKDSKSGKSITIASSAGIKVTTLVVDGKPVSVNVMAFIPK